MISDVVLLTAITIVLISLFVIAIRRGNLWCSVILAICMLGILYLLINCFNDFFISSSDHKTNPKVEVISIFIAAVMTFCAFFVQYSFNKKQKNDIHQERMENNIFNFMETLRDISKEISVVEIGNNKRAFHFIFYQYRALYFIFYEFLKHTHPDIFEKHKQNVRSISMSFLLSGTTNHSNKQIKDQTITACDGDEASVNKFFDQFENIVLNLQRLEKHDLETLYRDENLILFVDYAARELNGQLNNKKIEWFWGHRTQLTPYIKYLNMMVEYINTSNINNKPIYYDNIFNQMSEHEVGLLYLFCNSEESRIVSNSDKTPTTSIMAKMLGFIERKKQEPEYKLIALSEQWISRTNPMYDYKNWVVTVRKETLELVTKFSNLSPCHRP